MRHFIFICRFWVKDLGNLIDMWKRIEIEIYFFSSCSKYECFEKWVIALYVHSEHFNSRLELQWWLPSQFTHTRQPQWVMPGIDASLLLMSSLSARWIWNCFLNIVSVNWYLLTILISVPIVRFHDRVATDFILNRSFRYTSHRLYPSELWNILVTAFISVIIACIM